MSAPLAEIDENLWEEYLSELRTLSQDYEKSPALRPSIKDFYIWMSDKDMDRSDDEGY